MILLRQQEYGYDFKSGGIIFLQVTYGEEELSCPCFGSSVLASCIDLYAQVKTGSPKAVRFLIIMNLFLNRQYKLNVLRDIVMSILFLFVF